jgi:nucleoside-diphosphate-sugar epimerase
MHVFVTGGSGLTGPAIVAELIAAGHTVTGLARSDGAAARLQGLGAQALRGSLEDPDRLRQGAKAADGVIHMAFGGSFADPQDLVRRDRTAIQTLDAALASPGKPFVSTSGTFVMPAGSVSTEQDAPDPESIAWFRISGEQACLAFAEQGVSTRTQALLGWTPGHPTLLEDMAAGDYFS